MDKFCEDCIHNEVCQYGAIPPHTDRCNDKDTLDDIRPQGDIHDFIAKADEGILFQLKKEIENALTKIIEREAYEEARREAMRLDDNEDTYKWRGHA